MSKLSVTNFNKRTGSPFQSKINLEKQSETNIQLQQEVSIQKTNFDLQKQKQHELQEKVNKKTAEIQSHKNSDNEGCFTEIQAHGAFQGNVNINKKVTVECNSNSQKQSNGSKSLLSFPSSANDLALEAKSDLESDKNISEEVKEKVIKKLFVLASMVQNMYESKVRIMTEYEKFKEKHLKDEGRREKEHSEQLYKLNISFQSEVIQAIQQLRTELDISRNVTNNLKENNSTSKDSMVFNSSQENNIEMSDNNIIKDDVTPSEYSL